MINGFVRRSQIQNFFFKPINLDANYKNWDGRSMVNVAIFGDPILVVNFSPSEKSLKMLSIPSSTYTYIPNGYGWYRIGASYELGQLEGGAAGGLVFLRATESLLAVPIDYYIKFKDPKMENLKLENLKHNKDKFLGANSLLHLFNTPFWIHNNMDTNITLFDIYELWWKAKSARVTEQNYIDSSAVILEEIVLADGSKGFTAKDDELDKYSVKVFQDFNILTEGLSIAILNSTPKEGLATYIKRLLENIGTNVVLVGNYDKGSLSQSNIYVSNSIVKNSYTVKRISQVINVPIKKSEEILENSNADLTIILGEDKNNLLF